MINIKAIGRINAGVGIVVDDEHFHVIPITIPGNSRF